VTRVAPFSLITLLFNVNPATYPKNDPKIHRKEQKREKNQIKYVFKLLSHKIPKLIIPFILVYHCHLKKMKKKKNGNNEDNRKELPNKCLKVLFFQKMREKNRCGNQSFFLSFYLSSFFLPLIAQTFPLLLWMLSIPKTPAPTDEQRKLCKI
jgi:hypothetical protein